MTRNQNKDQRQINSKLSYLQNIKYLSIGSEYNTENYKENEILFENLDNEDTKIFKIPHIINELMNLESVSIKHSNVNTIDKVFFNFKNLKEIVLNNNYNLTELKANTFKDLPALKILDLHNNGIKTIQSGAFNNLPALTALNLSYNRINTIETGTFCNIPKLKEIDLEGNSISKLKMGSFDLLKTVTRLLISTQHIVNIEEATFKDIPNFRKLSNGLDLLPNKRMEGPLCKNFIEWSTTYNDKLSRLKEFYQVYINELMVSAFVRVPDLFNTAQTEKLVFINPKEKKKLEKINLPSNLKTIEIPFDVKQVTHLYLYNIGLKSIPDNINEYSNLKYLDISFNYIENSEIEKNEKIPKITKKSEEYRKLW